MHFASEPAGTAEILPEKPAGTLKADDSNSESVEEHSAGICFCPMSQAKRMPSQF
jgi:hypothetical protein